MEDLEYAVLEDLEEPVYVSNCRSGEFTAALDASTASTAEETCSYTKNEAAKGRRCTMQPVNFPVLNLIDGKWKDAGVRLGKNGAKT